MPCLAATSTGSISVGDDGTAADDAFSVAVDGNTICQTAIGATNNCALGALRQGSHTLTITCIVAPDDDGTLGVQINQANMYICLTATYQPNLCTTYLSLDMTLNQVVSYYLVVQ